MATISPARIRTSRSREEMLSAISSLAGEGVFIRVFIRVFLSLYPTERAGAYSLSLVPDSCGSTLSREGTLEHPRYSCEANMRLRLSRTTPLIDVRCRTVSESQGIVRLRVAHQLETRIQIYQR